MHPLPTPLPEYTARKSESHVEGDALREREVLGVIDRVRRAAHVVLPRVRARLAAAAGGFLAAERAADLRAARADVDVGDAAVRARRREELLGLAHVAGEDRARQALRHVVVDVDGLVEV